MSESKHDATHTIDQYCCAVLSDLTQVLPAAYAIDAETELRAVHDAIVKLHAAANRMHVLLIADCGAKQ
jgi:hypothetical protein